jgi:diguanylate cyclase (GGDEF)-like protein
MDYFKQKTMSWNQIILRIFWFVLAIEFASQILIFFIVRRIVTLFPTKQYFWHNVALPDTILLIIIGTTTWITHKHSKYAEASQVLAAGIIALTIINFISSKVLIAPIVGLFPLMISMLYLNRRYLIYSTICCLLYVSIILVQNSQLDAYFVIGIIVIGSVFIATCLTGLGIIRRGRELMLHLEKTIKSEQELLIRNIVMDRLSKIDALTDLYNHKTYHEYIEKLVEQRLSHEFPLQLAVLDIDNFKRVNDTYGHWVGDIVLKKVAACLKEHLDSDDFAARYGGEEFVVIFTSKSAETNYQALEAIREGIAAILVQEMNGGNVTVSIGTRHYMEGDNKESLFSLADKALYDAKHSGKNKIVSA